MIRFYDVIAFDYTASNSSLQCKAIYYIMT